MNAATTRKLAFAAVATASTAGLWFLSPHAHAAASTLFRAKNATISVSNSLSITCAVGDDLEDTLFVLHTAGDNYNSSYLPFEPDPPTSLPPLDHTDSLPLDCLESFFSTGARCEEWMSLAPRFDFVWTWVNGTDKLHQQASLDVEKEYFPARQRPNSKTPKELKLFRCADTLSQCPPGAEGLLSQ